MTSRRLLLALGGALVVSGAACDGPLSTLDPAGPQAQQIAALGWLMLAMAGGVTVLVVVLVGWAIWRGRRWRNDEPPPIEPMKLVIGGGIVLPLLMLPVVWVLSLQAMASLAGPADPPGLVIDVTGRQFSYAVSYPDHGIELTDELRIPVDRPVLLRLRSEDVIHSFWVPRLGGKMDLVPGQLNEMWIEASQPGIYQGRCAEFCGIGHTGMGLVVIALDDASFDDWLASAVTGRSGR